MKLHPFVQVPVYLDGKTVDEYVATNDIHRIRSWSPTMSQIIFKNFQHPSILINKSYVDLLIDIKAQSR